MPACVRFRWPRRLVFCGCGILCVLFVLAIANRVRNDVKGLFLIAHAYRIAATGVSRRPQGPRCERAPGFSHKPCFSETCAFDGGQTSAAMQPTFAELVYDLQPSFRTNSSKSHTINAALSRRGVPPSCLLPAACATCAAGSGGCLSHMYTAAHHTLISIDRQLCVVSGAF